MTAAYRLKGFGWMGGCVMVALGFYLVSLQVAAERKRLEQTDARIRVAQRDIRALETEFDTRANLTQLERWNGDTLALVAPGASQFVRDEAQLASIRFDAGQAGAPVRTAALVVPAFTAPAATPTIATAAATPAPVTIKVAAASPNHAPVTVRIPATATASAPRMVPAVATVAKAAPVRRQAVAMLLSDATLGDLVSGARSEARTLR